MLVCVLSGVMKLPKVQENSKLFEELMLGGSAGAFPASVSPGS